MGKPLSNPDPVVDRIPIIVVVLGYRARDHEIDGRCIGACRHNLRHAALAFRPKRMAGTCLGLEHMVERHEEDDLARLRGRKIGFVFQSFNLLSWMTALDNVELPLIYTGISRVERLRLAEQALAMVGLKSRLHHRPVELSGGQQQRVAIARALVTSPSLFLADEPTGNLDSRTSVQILTILQELNARGLTIVLVTHEADIASYANRQVKFRDGRIIDDTATVDMASTPLVITGRSFDGEVVERGNMAHADGKGVSI